MALLTGHKINASMKTGTTIVSNELRAWDIGGGLSYTPPSGYTGPATNVETLNGFPVATFNSNILSVDDPSLEREPTSNDSWMLQHFVIRYPDTAYQYIEDAGFGNQLNSGVTIVNDTEIWIRYLTNSAQALHNIANQWHVLTVFRDTLNDVGKVWINNTLVIDITANSAAEIFPTTGSTLGARADAGFATAINLDIAQYVMYSQGDVTTAPTQQQIDDNIAHLNVNWIDTAISGNVKENGTNVSGARVPIFSATNLELDGLVLEQTVITDASGNFSSTIVLGAKVYIAFPFWNDNNVGKSQKPIILDRR